MPNPLETIIIQAPATAAREVPATVRLSPGASVRFGRDPDLEVVLADPRAPRLAGRVHAVEDYWLITNLTANRTFAVENPESAGEYVKVAPRRLEMPIPFEFARVVVGPPEGAGPDADAGATFLVFAPQHGYADAGPGGLRTGEDTLAAFPLDENAKYFLVLVALCEPRLLDPASLVLPTAPEVAARLTPLPQCAELSRAAVNFQIDYLARTKLRVRAPEETHGKADWQREALVRLALRFDLVRTDHLKLLP